MWEAIATAAERESALWRDALLTPAEREHEAVFSEMADERYALGLETIYEGYLVHYGRPRLFRTLDPGEALLLGDYLYAHGLVRIAELGDVDAVHALAELIARCAHLRAENAAGDGEAWAETAAALGDATDNKRPARDPASALAAHARRVG